MHVLFVGPFPWPSHQGSQVYLAGQLRALAARHHRVTLATYGGTGGAIPGVEILRGRALPGVTLPPGGLHWSRPLQDLALARAIRRYCRAHEVQLLHTHNVEGPVVAALARTGLPVVYDLHTEMREELPTHLPALGRAAGRLGAALDTLALTTSQAGCAISPRALAVLAADGRPCRQVGMPIDPAELTPRSARYPGLPDRFVVYAGNLDRYQDLELLFRLQGALSAPLVVVTGSNEPVPAGVQVVRSRDFQVTVDVLHAATVGVVPRQQCSGMPVKLLNQLGLGLPTVVLDPRLQGLPGTVLATPPTLEAVLQDLLDAPRRRATLARLARSHIRQEHHPDVIGQRLEALYSEMLTCVRRRRPFRPQP